MKGYIKIGVEQGLISFNDDMSRIIYISTIRSITDLYFIIIKRDNKFL